MQVAHRTTQVSHMGNMGRQRRRFSCSCKSIAIVFPALNDKITQLNSTQLNKPPTRKENENRKNGYSRGLHSISSMYPAFLHELQTTDVKGLKNFVAYGHDVIQYSVGELLCSMLKLFA